MNRDDVSWRGYLPAVPTPFSPEGAIDYTALRGVIEHLVEVGAHGLVINGSTGEWFAQTSEERCELAAFSIAAADNRVPVIVGISALRVSESIAFAQHAAEHQADGVLLSPPAASRLTDEELIDYFEQVCASISLPVMLYNIPADGVANLSPAVIERLAGIDNVVAIKDNPSDELEFYETIHGVKDEIRVFGSLLNPVGAALISSGYGGDGYIGSGMPLGRDQAAFFEALWCGDVATARPIAERFGRLMSRLADCARDSRFGGMHAQAKAIMTLSGCYAGQPRPPRRPITDPEALATIRTILCDAGIDVPDTAPTAAS